MGSVEQRSRRIHCLRVVSRLGLAVACEGRVGGRCLSAKAWVQDRLPLQGGMVVAETVTLHDYRFDERLRDGLPETNGQWTILIAGRSQIPGHEFMAWYCIHDLKNTNINMVATK